MAYNGIGISPKPRSEWDENTKALNELYIGPEAEAGDEELTARVDMLEVYETTGTPDSNWDEDDSAGIGKEFNVNSFVQNITTGILYRCADATSGVAIWNIVVQEHI